MEAEAPKFTCLSCHVAFHSADHQREHYRTDWHRYNLKRKVAQLAPISAQQFAEKLLAQRAQAVEEQAQSTYGAECRLCGKRFASENAYVHHMRSKKHRETELRIQQGKQTPAKPDRLAQLRDAESTHDASSDAGSAADSVAAQCELEPMESCGNSVVDEHGMIDETATPEQVMQAINAQVASAPRLADEDCLFCGHHSSTFEENLAHMKRQHSFFIPDADYLTNLVGLIRYLGEKISVSNVCLYCNGRGRGMRSMEAVRRHMLDKGHTKIAYDSERDVLEIADFYDFRSSYPDYKKEDTEGDEEMALSEADSSSAVGDDAFELVLPSGARIGHRAMRRYYQQYVRTEDERESVRVNRMLTQHGHQQTQQRAQAQCRALELMSAFQRRQVFSHQALRRRHDFQTRVGIRANGLQKHFREQVLY